jgi:hypothetical protein
MATKLITCTCKHGYQDSKYGKRRRVANELSKSVPKKYRCTVCSNTK